MAIAVVQSVVVTGSSTNSVTTPAMTTTDGNLIIMDCVYQTGNFVSSTDNGTHVWSNSIAEISASPVNGRQQYTANITGRASHTFTLTLHTFGFPTLAAKEVTGQNATPLDKVASGTSTGTTHTTPDTAAITQADELLSGFGFLAADDDMAVSAPWVQDEYLPRVGGSGQNSIMSASQVVAVGGAKNFTYTSNSSSSTAEGISTWEAAGPAAPPVRYQQAIRPYRFVPGITR
jgi:hypothetical protein